MEIIIFLYFFPTLCAVLRKSHRTAGVVVLNILLGWTILFWFVALIWAFGSDKG